jgi:hypothetical protein
VSRLAAATVAAPSDPAPLPSSGLNIGFRASIYGITPMPSPEYWYDVGADARSKFSGAGIQGVWVIGCFLDDGTCYLNFPSSVRYPEISFAETDENEAYLSYFDRKGVSVYLQVEPGQASVDDLIRLVLGRYSNHPCVAGFGVDVEWYGAPEYAGGKKVTDQEAAEWYDLVSSYNKSYSLFLKHWKVSKMPSTYRKGIYFIDDSEGFTSLSDMAEEFARWGRSFDGSPVGFQIGYPEDEGWWSQYDDPYGTIGHVLLETVPNARGIYWVDFSLRDIYPA